MLYTAQYRYKGSDRLDITVKGNCIVGRLYAPSWAMVQGVKDGTLSKEDYTKQYYKLLVARWHNGFQGEMEVMVKMTRDQGRDVTVVCFCPSGTFCHRYLMVNFFKYNWDVPYGGERK